MINWLMKHYGFNVTNDYDYGITYEKYESEYDYIGGKWGYYRVIDVCIKANHVPYVFSYWKSEDVRKDTYDSVCAITDMNILLLIYLKIIYLKFKTGRIWRK